MPLRRGKAVPFYHFSGILIQLFAFLVQVAEVKLGVRVPLLGELAVMPYGLPAITAFSEEMVQSAGNLS